MKMKMKMKKKEKKEKKKVKKEKMGVWTIGMKAEKQREKRRGNVFLCQGQ